MIPLIPLLIIGGMAWLAAARPSKSTSREAVLYGGTVVRLSGWTALFSGSEGEGDLKGTMSAFPDGDEAFAAFAAWENAIDPNAPFLRLNTPLARWLVYVDDDKRFNVFRAPLGSRPVFEAAL